MSGLFIAFEGGDGAGKSTQAQRLHTRLTAENRDAILVREPGSTELGDYLRAYLVDGRPLTTNAELLLFEAARTELMTTIIEPSLDAGTTVVADRFAGSTVAYQGYGRGVDAAQIGWLNDFATGGRYPDLVALLDIDPEAALARAEQRQLALGGDAEGANNRFEDEAMRFHRAVRRGFLDEAARNSERWLTIDGTRPADEIAAEVWYAVEHLARYRDEQA